MPHIAPFVNAYFSMFLSKVIISGSVVVLKFANSFGALPMELSNAASLMRNTKKIETYATARLGALKE